jgi:ABC-2 type transport system ATP-binding protein
MHELIELQGVSRVFGTFQALSDVTLKLPPGRIGLLGPNGAGKSTLLKMLMGLLAPTSGSGTVLGQSIGSTLSGEGSFRLRQLIGFMPEAEALVPGLKGIDYVSLAGELYGMPRKQAQRRAHEMLSFLELEDARYRRLDEYSTGMKQRIKLAQALVHDPPLLLLDEPTSGLDPAGRDAMLRLLLELGRDFGKSLILSTHLLADVETVCEQVVILLNGTVRGQGSVSEICSQRQNRYRLQVQGNLDPFRESCQHRGVQILSDNSRGEWRVAVPEPWSPREFFLLAQQNSILLRGVQRDDETLEEMFLRTAQMKFQH